MGATVISDGVVTFRFHCSRCQVQGEEHADQGGAEADLRNHWYSWHAPHDGEADGYDSHWTWYCRPCMQTLDEYHSSSEAEALAAGYSHWLTAFHHQGEAIIEQLGTYDCAYEEDPSESD